MATNSNFDSKRDTWLSMGKPNYQVSRKVLQETVASSSKISKHGKSTKKMMAIDLASVKVEGSNIVSSGRNNATGVSKMAKLDLLTSSKGDDLDWTDTIAADELNVNTDGSSIEIIAATQNT